MNLGLPQLREILEGRFDPSLIALLLQGEAEPGERIPFPSVLVSEDVDGDDVALLFREWIASGALLRALALLKVVGDSRGPDRDLLALLSEALQIDAAEDSTDPLPFEFLGTKRARIAWSVLQRDSLAFLPLHGGRLNLGSRGWLVSSSEEVGDDRLPHGLALVWRSTTRVAGALRPAGTRKQARRRLELSSSLIFVGPIRDNAGLSRVSADVQDLSDTGAGVCIRDRFGRLSRLELKGARVRLELRKPDQKDPMATLATIRWVEHSTHAKDGHVCRLGLKFEDPPPEFLSSVQELLSPGKGDVQYLWSLWESDSGKA